MISIKSYKMLPFFGGGLRKSGFGVSWDRRRAMLTPKVSALKEARGSARFERGTASRGRHHPTGVTNNLLTIIMQNFIIFL
jgi:hypothetical protein